MKFIVAAALVAGASAYQHKHKHAHRIKNALSSKYEPEWGHNSGNSYNNGPTTHFYHGKASPYSVTKEDV